MGKIVISFNFNFNNKILQFYNNKSATTQEVSWGLEGEKHSYGVAKTLWVAQSILWMCTGALWVALDSFGLCIEIPLELKTLL